MTNLMSQMYIMINGSYASEDLMEAVQEIVVDTSLHMPAMFTIRIKDDGLKWIDSPQLEIGKAVSIAGRAEGSNQKINVLSEGEITAVEPNFSEDQGVVLLIRGYDKSHRMYHSKKNRVFIQMTDSDIVSKIGRECGLNTSVESTAQVYTQVFQVSQSDIDFLQERADRNGYFLYVKDGVLNFRSEPFKRQSLSLDWGDNLIDIHVRLSTSEQVSNVEVHGWDPVQKMAIVGRSESPENTPVIDGENHGGDFTRKAFGFTREEVISRDSVVSQSEADTLAQSILNERGQAFFEAEGTCMGNPQLNAGAEITIKGIGRRFSGAYNITRAIHRYDYSGYTTQFEISGHRANTVSQLVTSCTSNAGTNLVVGIVTNLNDPDGLARVKVKFPSISDSLESGWARLVNPMAGFEFVPEVNDEVLVAFENADINKPYILGVLWNGKDKPPETSNSIIASNGKVQKCLIHSRSGHRITIDDSDGKEKISIVDKTGNNSIDIDSGGRQIAIKTEGDIQMEAKGKITLKGTDISLEAIGNAKVKGGGVDINATGQMNLESSAMASIKASAVLELKGAVVKIN